MRVTTPARSNLSLVTARSLVRASLPLAVLGAVQLATPAHADPAEGWSDAPGSVDMLDALLLLAGVPLLLFVLIAMAVYLPALVRGEKLTPAGGPQDQWLGGPRSGTKELAASESTTSETGGARGSW